MLAFKNAGDLNFAVVKMAPQQQRPPGQAPPPQKVPPDPPKNPQQPPKNPPQGVAPPKTPPTPRQKNPFKLPSLEAVEENEDKNQYNHYWRFASGLDAIPTLKALSARLCWNYILLIPAAARANAKWTPREKDAATQMRKHLGQSLILKATNCKGAAMVMSHMANGFWDKAIDIANFPEAAAAGYNAQGGAPAKALRTTIYIEALSCVAAAALDFEATTDRDFRLITVSDGGVREESNGYIQGQLLVPPDIAVMIYSLVIADATKILIDLYDTMDPDLRILQIRKWSNECMCNMSKSNFNTINFEKLHYLVLQVEELNGVPAELQHAKDLLYAVLFRHTMPDIVIQKNNCQDPAIALRTIIMGLQAAARKQAKQAHLLARTLGSQQSARQAFVGDDEEDLDEPPLWVDQSDDEENDACARIVYLADVDPGDEMTPPSSPAEIKLKSKRLRYKGNAKATRRAARAALAALPPTVDVPNNV